MKRYMLIMIVIITLLLIIDLYAYKGLMHLLHDSSSTATRGLFTWIYWGISVAFFVMIILAFTLNTGERDPKLMSRYFFLGGIMLAIYIPKLFFGTFHLAEDILKLIGLGIQKLSMLFVRDEVSPAITGEQISRFKFITQLGLVIAAIPFFSIIWGMIRGRFNFTVSQHKLVFPNLPEAFDGFRIVHISDIHIGSLYGHESRVREAIDMINAQDADLVLFTGDMVNDYVEELNGWKEILSGIRARMGKYSILGNHDYGDYYNWGSEEAKRKNLEDLVRAQEEMGFRMLLNQSVRIEKDGQYFALIGVENWGKPPFAQYGDYRKASAGMNGAPFKILMSHDPTHWDAEIQGKTDVDLTLSGHTHGMQFGIEIGNVKWSPVQWKYPHWAGLYRETGQYLYVNRGFGYIGYPGRIGMPPEITVIDLSKA